MPANDFLTTYTPLANDIAEHTGIDPTVVLGIIDTETGGGVHVKSNNIFGISPGGKVASYPDVQTAANTFIDLMQTPRYRGVTASPDPAAQALALVRAGYNTANPQYASIVSSKATGFAKQLGYQDPPAANNANTPPAQQDVGIVPDEALKPGGGAAPARVTPATANEKMPVAGTNPDADAILQELGVKPAQLVGTPKPTAPAQSANPDADALITELNKPVEHGAVGGGAKRKEPVQPSYTSDSPMGDQGGSGGSAMPSTSHILRDVVMAGEGLPAPSMQPAPGALRRVLGAAYEGGHNAPDASAWAPAGVPLGQYIVNPLLTLGGAAFKGGQQFMAEATGPIGRDLPLVGHPGLGRDVAAMPEAFPTGDYGQPTVRPAPNALERPPGPAQTAGVYPQPNALDPRGVPIRDFTPPPEARPTPPPGGGGTTGLENLGGAATAIGDNLRDMLWTKLQKGDTTELGKPSRILIEAKAAMGDGTIRTRADFDAWMQQLDGSPGKAGGAGQAAADTGGPVGADVTRRAIPDQTRIERATNIRKDVSQTAEERAGPGMRDDTVYYKSRPGHDQIPHRMDAFRDFSEQRAIDHKYYFEKDPEYRAAVKRNMGERHKEMWDDLRQEMGDENTIKQLEDARKEYTPEKMGVFRDERPVDPALAESYRAHFAEEVAKFEKNDMVGPLLNKAYQKLFDKDGNLETLPSRFQQVRNNMRNILEQKAGATELSQAVRTIERELTDLVEGLNPVMQSGASKWDAWRAKWAEMSKPIDRQKFLQQYAEG